MNRRLGTSLGYREVSPRVAARIITLQFLGLLVFTAIVVTNRWSGAEFAMVFALAAMLMGHDRIRFPAPFWWGLAFVGWAYAVSFLALSPEIAQSAVYDRLKVVLILLVVMNALRTDRQIKIYLVVVVGSFMIYPARGTILNYLHGDTVFGRAAWNQIYANPNDLAAMSLLAMGAALALYSRNGETRWVRLGAAVSAGTLLLVTLLTQSRGGFIGLLIGFGPSMIRRLFKKPRVFIYAVIATAVLLAILPDALWVRLSGLTKLTSTTTIAQADPEGSAEQRWQIQQTAWRIFIDHPIVGVGLGCYPLANKRYSPELGSRDTHDTYLNLAAELGIPGLIFWLGLVSAVFVHVRRYRPTGNAHRSSAWLESGVVAYLGAGIFGSYSGITLGYLILGALWSSVTVGRYQGAPQELGRANPLKARNIKCVE